MVKKKKKKVVEEEAASTSTSDDILAEILGAGKEDGAQLLGSDGLAIKIRGVISTQCPGIDAVLGRGGVPLSRLVIVAGKEGGGKTTLALHLVAECQKNDGIVIYIDSEYKLDPDYAKAIGVDTKKLVIVQPPYLERVFKLCHSIIEKAADHRKRTGKRTPILIVLDSMNASISKVEYEGEEEDRHYAPQAGVYSRLLPKLIPAVSNEDVCLLMISQIRKNIGAMFGDGDSFSGGNAPRFYASVIMKVTRIGNIKGKGDEKEEKVASKVKIEVVKNQIAPPFKKTVCEIRYGKGFDCEKSLVELAVECGVVEKKGAHFSYDGSRIGHGADAAADLLRKNRDLYEEILKETREVGKW